MTENNQRAVKDLTEGPIFKLLLIFAAPMILATLLQQLYSIVDLWIIGKYVGDAGTVAIASGGEIANYMTLSANAIAVGAQIYISQLSGKKDIKRLREGIGTTLTLEFGLSIFIVLIILLFRNGILSILNCPEEAWGEALAYMVITAFGLPFVFGYNGLSAAFRGMGDSLRPLVFITISTVMHLLCNLLFIVGFQMGVAGAALSTALSQFGSCAAAIFYMHQHKEKFAFEFSFRYFRVTGDALRRILLMAVPQLIRVLMANTGNMFIRSQINSFGMIPSTTYSIGSRVEGFLNVFVTGLDGAIGAMIGQNIGARKYDRVYKIMYCALAFSGVLATAVAILFLAVPRTLMGIFSVNTDVIELGVTLFRILAVNIYVSAIATCYKSISTGAGASDLMLLIGLFDLIGRVGGSLLLDKVFHMGVISYFWGSTFCFIIPGLLSFAYFTSGRWKARKLITER